MKNYAGQTLWLTLFVTLFLAGLSFLPADLHIGDIPLRPMDIFSDIRSVPPTPEPLPMDTIPTEDTVAMVEVPHDTFNTDGILPPVDSALFGQIFEDYTPEQQGLATFFAAVDSTRAHKRTVRVAFFGDSFVEGDILLGDLRDTLQTLWGGNGVGFVPITSEVARFKRTLLHEYDGWSIHSIVKKTPAHPQYGINGFVYSPLEGAKVRYEGAGYFRHTRSWSKMRLFYGGDSISPIYYTINGATAALRQPEPLNGAPLAVFDLKYPGTRSVELNFPQPGGLLLYGATLEDGPGFYLDNFSVRGNSGGKLKLISRNMMQAFDYYQRYDLIVIQLGLNAVTNTLDNIEWYRYELDETFAHLRRCFPNRPVLVIGVPDRAGKVENELRTLPAVPAIVEMQRDLARKHGFLFYDLYKGMGGPGSMLRLAAEKPALANKDYTHLTHEGGRAMSRLFTKLLLEEKERIRNQPRPANL